MQRPSLRSTKPARFPSIPRLVKSLTAVAALALTAAFATACGSTSDTPNAGPTGNGFPATVGSLTLDSQPHRIVSLAPSLTEMLFAIDAGQQVVAVDEYSTFPASAPKTKLSGYTPNAEAIAAYTPDLVVVSDDSEGIIGQLTALHIPVYQGKAAEGIDDTYRELTELGTLTGHGNEAQALVSQMRDQMGKLIASIPKRSTPLTYYYELDNTYYTVTSKSFIGALFTNAGLTNIADAGNAANPYPQLSAETILAANPDLIFLADTKCCGQNAGTVAARPGWGTLKAVTNKGVIPLDDDIASRWGPRVLDLQRSIVDAVAAAPAN
jgi:iron complex transport system substrate-binding protein